MESFTYFKTVEEYEAYANPKDETAYVETTDKVYLEQGRTFKYVIHATFNVTATGSSAILGNDCILSQIARIKITSPSGKIKYLRAQKNYNFSEIGTYTIDYGIYNYNTTPSNMFISCPYLTYIQVDPDVVNVVGTFAQKDSNLTGILFGNEYPEIEVFDEPYNEQDVILGDHITSFTGGNFLTQCHKIRNIYTSNNISSTPAIFGAWTNYGVVTISDLTKYPRSKMYIGKSNTSVNQLYNQNKIWDFVVHPENPKYIVDSVTRSLLDKVAYETDGTKRILVGANASNDNGYLYIPAGYIISSYDVYCERLGVKIVDLRDYNYKTSTWYSNENEVRVQGFRENSSLQLMILPKQSSYIGLFQDATPNINILSFIPEPPVSYWGNAAPGKTSQKVDGVGTANSLFSQAIGMAGNRRGSIKSSTHKHIYVLRGTEEQQSLWTNEFDNTNTVEWGTSRPNRWHYMTSDYDTAPVESRGSDESHSAYNGMILEFKTQDELDSIIQSYIEAL